MLKILSIIILCCLGNIQEPKATSVVFLECYDEKAKAFSAILNDLDLQVGKKYPVGNVEESYRALAHSSVTDKDVHGTLYRKKKIRKIEKTLRDAGILDDFYIDFNGNRVGLNSAGDYYGCLLAIEDPRVQTYLSNFLTIEDNMPANVILGAMMESKETELDQLHWSILKIELVLDLIERSYY